MDVSEVVFLWKKELKCDVKCTHLPLLGEVKLLASRYHIKVLFFHFQLLLHKIPIKNDCMFWQVLYNLFFVSLQVFSGSPRDTSII